MKDLPLRAERIELLAMRSLYEAPRATFAAGAGIVVVPVGNAAVSVLRAADGGTVNRVLGLGVDAEATEEDVAACIDVYARHGIQNFFVQLAPGARPPTLVRWLTGRDLTPHARSWTKFVHSLERPEDVVTELALKQAEAEHATMFGEVACAAFGLPATLAPWLSALVGREGWRVVLAFEGALAVACGALFVQGRSAWLGLGGTLPRHRGRRAQQALLAWRVERAIGLGCDVIVTETGEAVAGEPQVSERNILRAGFQIAYIRPNYTRAVATGGT